MRPCVIVSPDELNVYLRTFIVAPLTTGGHPYPFRVPCRFGRRAGHVVLDQIRHHVRPWGRPDEDEHRVGGQFSRGAAGGRGDGDRLQPAAAAY